ncbi:MAG: hypothetical protein AAFO74_05960 [Pseudomonadota bacterium]
MAKVEAHTMTPNHVKAARALLGLSAEDFAKALPIGVATLRTFEAGKDIKDASKAAIFEALSDHGVIMQNGGSPGVRITEPEKWKINLKATRCSECGYQLPALRKPSNLRQVLWGGWTCPSCGSELNKSGQKLFRKT